MNHSRDPHQHIVQFYETEDHLSDVVSRFLAPGAERGNPMVVIATHEHGKVITERLRAAGVDVEALLQAGQFAVLDAQAALSSFMVNDLPDKHQFNLTIGAAIEPVRGGRGNLPVLAFGEMADILWRQGKPEAAILLERFWNELAEMHTLTLLCAYSMNGFYKESHSSQFAEICAEHSSVNPTERYSRLAETDQMREISSMQQRSLALENEIHRRQEIRNALLCALEDRRQIENKLQKVESGLRDFVENAVVGFQWVEADGRIAWVNQTGLEILGYSREEYVGRHIADFHVDEEIAADILARYGRHEALVDYEARLRHKDGSIRYALINSTSLWQDENFVHTRCFMRDITAIKQKERVESLLSAIVESADDAIIGKTLDGIVVSWNAAAARLFGYSAEEIIGKSILTLVPPELSGEESDILGKLRKGERIEHYETKRRRKDGAILDISITVSPVKDKSGRIIAASKIARDITYRKWVEAERDRLLVREQAARSEAEAAKAEAVEASRLKDEFLAILSHELRTPLNAIMGWASILGSRNDEGSLRHAVDVIQRNAGLQKRLIEDLLDMSRILSGKLTIKNQRVDLVGVMKAAVDSVQPAIAAKMIKLDIRADEAIRFISGDADRLQQVIWNLLANAVKFTPSNGRIELSLRRNDAHAEISVCDTGQGIKPEFLPYIFDRFRQGDGSAARRHGGLGLGLAVVRYLIEAHGGSVSAHSDGEGLGATITIRLPAALIQTIPVKVEQTPNAIPNAIKDSTHSLSA